MSHAEKPSPPLPISWRALQRSSDVISADGVCVGAVERVVVDGPSDIFEGIVIDVRGGPGGLRFVDASQLGGMFDGRVVLTVSEALIHGLPAPRPGWR